jgi:PAS domain S-box-containing protein
MTLLGSRHGSGRGTGSHFRDSGITSHLPHFCLIFSLHCPGSSLHRENKGDVPSLFSLLSLVLLVLLIWLLSVPAHSQTQPRVDLTGKNVLILHSHEANAPVFLDTDKGLSDTLSSGGISSLNQFFQSLNLRRNPSYEYRKLLGEQMRIQYSHLKPDMIITMFPEALEFMLKDCRDVLPDVPILALYLPEGFELPETGRGIIGHSAKTDIIGTFEIALKLVPRAKRVYVVSGAHKVDRKILDRARRELKKWEGQIEFLYLSHMPFEDMLATISTAPPDSIILALVLSQDVTGTNYTSAKVAQRLSQISKAPIFGLLDAALGDGIAGGSLINFERIGAKAGELVLDILRGTPTPDNIPKFLDAPAVPMFDWRQLKHWNLSLSALPKESIIINKELTLWDFKYYIIGGIAVFLAQTMLVIGLLVQRNLKKKAESSVRHKTEELDQFFNVTLDVLCIANTDGYFLRLNPAAERILGYTREELMAKKFLDFIHPDDLDRSREAVSGLGSQQKVFFLENRYRCKDGSYRWLEWSAAPAGKLIYAAARDVTERKQSEKEALDARRELLRMDRLSRMGEMSASLSHELNQPLTAILSNAGAALRFLKSGKLDPGELEEILQDIVKDDKRAGEIIRSLRAMVKPEEGERELISINEVLDETVALFRSEAIIRNVRIEMDLTDPLPILHVNKVQIQQVLINLMMNAAESMTGDVTTNRVIVLQTLASHDGAIQVAVRDFGSGVEERELHKIFEPFFTTKRSGLGMGLSLSRSIIESHGGHIWAQNNPDEGITFYFDLPGSKSEGKVASGE